ncbi:MAG: tRNA glutamyl-Q(34) synthetase GluQRS [Proteobacteria bacterium]|nr:tRNA glutamyl-Q(34) synthetase GluQRS [Pseudomonadota bacterium]
MIGINDKGFPSLTTLSHNNYIGRFAPSPTGPLHTGSLFTAVASYLDARHHQGKWLLRIDDLDTPRNKGDSVAATLKTLEAFGLYWDSSVYYQSQHLDDYATFLVALAQSQLTYRCICSRKLLANLPSNESSNTQYSIYPSICRHKSISPDAPHAIRIKTSDCTLSFNDKLQGTISHNLAKQYGDFILKRKDGIIAYQFAVVVDDYLQGINYVVRGCDLLAETPKQIYLQQLLGFPTPAYMHAPVIVDQHGYKLSKQTLATAVDTQSPNITLFGLLVLLKQNPPDSLFGGSVSELLGWAIIHWRTDELALCSTISM